MTAIYVTSLFENAGKTVLCAGLARHWQNSGKKTAYVKISSGVAERQQAEQGDVYFMQKLLGSRDSAILAKNSHQDVKAAYQSMNAMKDIVLFEGLPLNVSQSVIEASGARVLVLHDYDRPLDAALAEYKKTGNRLLGVILNRVPKRKLNQVRAQAAETCARSGVAFLGILP